MLASVVNNKGRAEKNKKVMAGKCIIPFRYKRQEHNKCVETEKGPICATEVNPKTKTLTKYGYCKDKEPEVPGHSEDSSLKTDKDEVLGVPEQIQTQNVKSNKDNKLKSKPPPMTGYYKQVVDKLKDGEQGFGALVEGVGENKSAYILNALKKGIDSGTIERVNSKGDLTSYRNQKFKLADRKMKTVKKVSVSSAKKPMTLKKGRKRVLKIVGRIDEASKTSTKSKGRRNDEYIKILEELQDINARKGEPFRARAYQKAAESIMLHEGDITSPDQIKSLPGIGETILAKLKEYDETGTLRAIEKQKNDPLNVLTKVYGIGPKKAKVLISEGITTIADLRKNEDKLDRVQKIGLEHYEAIEERIPREEIERFNDIFTKVFKSLDVKGGEFQIVGSYRRGAKSSGDIDVIITNKDSNSPEILARFVSELKKKGIITHILSQGRSKCLAVGKLSPTSTPRRLDFLFAPKSEYAFATLYFTGSKTFNTRQRQRALDLGMTLNEHGLYRLVAGKKGSRIEGDFPDEQSIFKYLGMDYLTPKQRDDARRPIVVHSAKQSKVGSKNEPDIPKKETGPSSVDSPTEHLEAFARDGSSYLETLSKAQIQKMLQVADQSYYEEGNPLLSDDQYDALQALVASKDIKTGHKHIEDVNVRDKVKLPYEMWSMDKIKPDTKALANWVKKYKGPYVLSCKLDGVSGLFTTMKGDSRLYTRGNGIHGQDISRFIKYMSLPDNKSIAIRGEFIIPKALFASKYADKFSNARNFVAGVLNSKKPDPEKLKDIDFVAYEVIEPVLKSVEQLEFLVNNVDVKVVEHVVEPKITNDLLSELLVQWRENYEYEVDGVVCTNDGVYKRKSKNPLHAFAFKMVLGDQVAEAQVVDVIWTASKDGLLKPRVKIVPVVLGGAKIEYATGFNAKFISDNKIGVGAIISLIRSGDVIPHIMGVIRPAPEPLMPSQPYVWNSTHVDIILVDKDKDVVVQEKQIVGFFKALGVDGLRLGYVKRLIEAGYDTVPKILKMSQEEFLNVRGVKGKLAKKMYEGIRERMTTADLPLIMHATNIFGRGLGKKKLRTILSAFPDILTSKDSKEELEKQVVSVSGMGNKSAELFVEQLPVFRSWAQEAGVRKLTFTPSPPKTGVLSGIRVVLSGFRDSELSDEIEERGGEVGSSVSAGVNYVLVNDIDSDSGKAEKARKLGIPLITLEDFRQKFGL